MTHNYIPNQGTNGVFFAPLHNIRWPVRDGDQKLKKNEERSYTHEWRLNIPNGLALECFSRFNRPYIINWICLPTENCSHLTGIRPECDVFWSDKTENHTTTGNEKEKQRKQGEWKEEKRKKQWLHSQSSLWLLWYINFGAIIFLGILRESQLLQCPLPILSKNSFSYRGLVLWNRLLVEVWRA